MVKEKSTLKKNLAIAIGLIVLFIITLILGTAYWLFVKAERMSDSALNIQSAKTQTPAVEGSADTTLAMPLKDVSGTDLGEAPRYEGSIRSNYYVSSDQQFYSVEYFAGTSKDKIADFYKNYLGNTGWVVSNTDLKTIVFINETNELTLEFINESRTAPFITQYSLNLTKSNL